MGTLLAGLAAWQPAVRKRATGDERPSVVTPIGVALASLAILVYDHFEPVNLLALGRHRRARRGAHPALRHAPSEPPTWSALASRRARTR